MTINLVNGATWGVGDELTSSQINDLDENVTFALDKRDGQVDSLQSVVSLSLAGRIVDNVAAGADADTTYAVDAPNRVIQVTSAVTANRAYGLSATGAVTGDQITIYCESSFVYEIEVQDQAAVAMFTLGNVSTSTGNWASFIFTGSGWGLFRYASNLAVIQEAAIRSAADDVFEAKTFGSWDIIRTHPAPPTPSPTQQQVRPWFTKRDRMWYTSGPGDNTTRKTRNFGAKWTSEDTAGATALLGCNGAANNNPNSAQYGDMFCGSFQAAKLVYHFFAHGTGWTTQKTHGLAAGLLASVVHDETHACWIFVDVTAAGVIRCVTCDDASYTFTTRALPGSPACTQGTTDPTLTISSGGVALFQSEAGNLARSTDGGATWAAVVVSPDLINRRALAYVEDLSKWVYAASDGTIQSSDDGITWVEAAATNPATDLGGSIGVLNSVGPVLYATWVDAITDQGGVMFSLDAGVTWAFAAGPMTRTTSGQGTIGCGDDSALIVGIPGGSQNYDGYSFAKHLVSVTYGSLA